MLVKVLHLHSRVEWNTSFERNWMVLHSRVLLVN